MTVGRSLQVEGGYKLDPRPVTWPLVVMVTTLIVCLIDYNCVLKSHLWNTYKVYLYVCLSVWLSVCLSVFIYLFIYLFIYSNDVMKDLRG